MESDIDYGKIFKDSSNEIIARSIERFKKDLAFGLLEVLGVKPEPEIQIKKVRVCHCCGNEFHNPGHDEL
jgi:hypothetical protein